MDEENDFYQFELLDIIENAVSNSASPLHDHEQVLASTGPDSELLNPDTTAAPANCPYSSAGYTPGGGGFVRADVLDAIEDDPESVSNLPSISSENDNTAQLAAAAIEQQSWFQVLQQISDREIEATRLKNEAMFNDIQLLAITRRYSDPTSFANAAPTPSNFMGRPLTETAVPMLSNNPGGKGRLREWLLAQLKDDPLQRRMYRNILMCEGLQTPADETWETRASLYWDIDHASDGKTESIDSFDEDDEFTVTRATGHEPRPKRYTFLNGYWKSIKPVASYARQTGGHFYRVDT
jgi:hypothetical protein